MYDNSTYNLMMRMVAEHKSLWRIKNMYKKDAAKCKECMSFWEKLETDKENHIKELSKLIKQHIE